MSDFFDGVGLALSGIFGAIYPDGILHRITETFSANGDVIAADQNISIKAKKDSATEAMRQDAGYSDKDVAIYVLNPNLTLVITTDDQITCEGERYHIGGPIRKDTAGSHYVLRATPV